MTRKPSDRQTSVSCQARTNLLEIYIIISLYRMIVERIHAIYVICRIFFLVQRAGSCPYNSCQRWFVNSAQSRALELVRNAGGCAGLGACRT